jgi:hypothetical protein
VPNTSPFLVELMLYSGRVNPKWLIDQVTYSAIVRVWESLLDAENQRNLPPKLGYSGVSLFDGLAHWSGFSGLAWHESAELTLCRNDPGKVFERALLATRPSEIALPPWIQFPE